MKQTKYLYDVEPTELIPMDDGLLDRIEKGSKLLEKLQETPLEQRDWARIHDVTNAIEHNTLLLEQSI